jgi:hypothetical protein
MNANIPDYIPALSSAGFRPISLDGACWLILIQRGTEADRVMTDFMRMQTEGLPPPPKLQEPKAPATLQGVSRKGIGIFPCADASWILVVKMHSPEEEAICEWIESHGLARVPRPKE